MLTVATDGAAFPTNPRPGGWGWVTEDGREGPAGCVTRPTIVWS